MMRIFKISGTNPKTRAAQLKKIKAWMESRGWQMAYYEEEIQRAAFMRPADAPKLPLLDRSRWSSGPGGSLFSLPRIGFRTWLLGIVVMALSGAMFIFVLTASHTPRDIKKQRADGSVRGETWLYVSSNVLNIRESPNATARITGMLYQDQRVLVGTREEGWAEVRAPERGFVADKFLSDHPTLPKK